MLITEHTLDVGDNSLAIKKGAVRNVFIEGLRRPTKLVRLSDDDEEPFATRNREMRGTPAAYIARPGIIYFWPAAIHRWKIIVEYEE